MALFESNIVEDSAALQPPGKDGRLATVGAERILEGPDHEAKIQLGDVRSGHCWTEGCGKRRRGGHYLNDLKVALFFDHHAFQVSYEPFDSRVISVSALLITGISSWARFAGLSSLRTVKL